VIGTTLPKEWCATPKEATWKCFRALITYLSLGLLSLVILAGLLELLLFSVVDSV